MSRALLLLACCAMASPALADGRVECSSMKSAVLGRAVPYCALLPSSYDADPARRYPILYFLHGLGDNEQSLVNSGGWSVIEDLRASKRIGEFLVVTPTGGRSFYINSRDGRNRYEDFFIREFMPGIERKYRAEAGRANRGISGISMGGYGALRFAFKYPNLFASVSGHSSALMAKLPAGVVSGSAGAGSGTDLLGAVFGSPVDRAFFDRNNALTLARQQRILALRGVRIYFDCGQQDDYGFDAGASALHRLLERRGVPHEFHLYPGRHDWAYFISHLPQSMEFHSRAFGLTQK